jgi:hydrogenase maturation protease
MTERWFPATIMATEFRVLEQDEAAAETFGLAQARRDVMVIGIGNPLRGDDAVGIHLVQRLKRHFTGDFKGIVAYEADIGLAEEISCYPALLVIDALAASSEPPFQMLPLPAASTIFPAGGFSSHAFNWGMVLAMARDIFGRCPEAFLCGIRAHSFAIDERLSPLCQTAADAAFDYLTRLLAAEDADGEAQQGWGGLS